MKRIHTLLILVSLLMPLDAFAARAPWTPGMRATEPTGLSALSIRHQTVQISADPTAENPRYGVWTKYEIEASEAFQTTLRMRAYTLEDAASYSVRLAGQQVLPRIEFTPRPKVGTVSTPCLEREGECELVERIPETMPALMYDLEVPAGEHELIIHWKGRAGAYRTGSFEPWTHQIPFVFTDRADRDHPVDIKLSFAGDVRVRASLPLQNLVGSGDHTLKRARFDAAPTTPFAVSFQEARFSLVTACAIIGGVAALFIGLLVTLALRRSRRNP